MTDEQAIREAIEKWMKATREGDTEAVLGLMTDDVVFLVPGRAPMDKQEFAALSRLPAGSTPPQIDSRSEIQEIVISGDPIGSLPFWDRTYSLAGRGSR